MRGRREVFALFSSKIMNRVPTARRPFDTTTDRPLSSTGNPLIRTGLRIL
jgi:hypothetical protein